MTFPTAAVPPEGLSLSASVSFGATTFAAGAVAPILFDLGGFDYTASGRINLKSSVTFTKGGTVSAGAGRLFENVHDLVLHVTGATTFLSRQNLGLYRSRDVSLTFAEDAVLDCTQHDNYNIAFYLESVSDAELTFDHATAKFYTVNIGGKENGKTGPVSNLNWTVCNGAAVSFHNYGISLSRGVYLGSSKADGYSVSNRLTVADAMFDCSKGEFRLCGQGDRLAVTNATFTTKALKFLNARDCEVAFTDSTVAGAISFGADSCGNALTVADCATFPNVTVDGVSNRVVLARGASTRLPTFAGGGAGKTFEIAGGAVTNTSFTFSGTNVTVVVRDGGRLQYGVGAVTRDGFNFKPGQTKDVTLRVADGGTVGIRGMVNFFNNETATYDWTNCPNSAIEFTGHTSSLVCHDYTANYQTLGLGTADETPLTDAVALRFVVPAGGYAAAPIRNEIKGRDIRLWGNQPIEIRLADGFVPTKALRVPLVSCVNGFSQTPMDAARLAKLTANATFPDAEAYKTALRYDAATKTLVASIRPRRGALLILR